MLFLFFLKKFYKSFTLFFIVLICLLSASDIFVRLPIISSLAVIPKLFLLMLPLMAQFAIPIASCLSIQMVLGSLHIEDEVILLHFFSSARKVLHKTILFFSFSLLVIQIPIIFKWAPQSYKKGKQLILDLAKKHFTGLQPKKFHNLANNFSIYFEEQSQYSEEKTSLEMFNVVDNKLFYKKLLLMFRDKNGTRYIINAQDGYLANDVFVLNDGFVQNISGDDSYISEFKRTEIDLNNFLNIKKDSFRPRDLKFYSFSELKSKINNGNFSAELELHKRIAQILWQLLFPFLALFLIMIFAKKKSNLLISVFLSGALFLTSYILLNMVKTLSFLGMPVIILFYLPLMIITLVSAYFYIKKI